MSDHNPNLEICSIWLLVNILVCPKFFLQFPMEETFKEFLVFSNQTLRKSNVFWFLQSFLLPIFCFCLFTKALGSVIWVTWMHQKEISAFHFWFSNRELRYPHQRKEAIQRSFHRAHIRSHKYLIKIRLPFYQAFQEKGRPDFHKKIWINRFLCSD